MTLNDINNKLKIKKTAVLTKILDDNFKKFIGKKKNRRFN